MSVSAVMAVAGALKPGMLDEAGNVVKKTGEGIGHIVHSVGTVGTEHHKIAKDAENERLRILSGMSPEQLQIVLRHEHEQASHGRKKLLKAAAMTTPLGPLLFATDLISPRLV